MRTLVVSDLHLGGRTGADALRHPQVLEPLLAQVRKAGQLVLLGDLLELRHGPSGEALAAAEPVLRAIGEALPAGAPCVVLAGNHDHALVAPWLEGLDGPLGLERRVAAAGASPAAARVARWLGEDRTTLAYPGVRLRDDVYALHGHYLDVHATLPTFERLAAGAMIRLTGAVPSSGATAEDYERVLAPLYAWNHASAQRARPRREAAGANRSIKGYELLTATGRRPLKARAATVAFPLAVAALNRAGLGGPLSPDLSGPALRASALSGIAAVAGALGIGAAHVIFGHSHRAGPLPGDDLAQWRTAAGTALHNTGTWVRERPLSGPDASSPYWPGRAILVEDEGPPVLLSLLEDVEVPAA